MEKKFSNSNQTNERRLWLLFAGVAIVIFIIHLGITLISGLGGIIMPLDDVYIHFQYARQLADGQPYIYNPGQLPTSGATSFLYPYLLAIGHLIGFQELNLGIWAMLLGTALLTISMWTIYHICLEFGVVRWLAIAAALLFAFTGTFTWHFMSGMETGIVVAFLLLTWLAVIRENVSTFVISASILSLTRPEASALAAVASIVMLFRLRRKVSFQRRLLLLMPIAAAFVQPIVNHILTGSFSASGSQAKSLFGIIPFDFAVVLGRVVENFVRMWVEFFTGYDPSRGLWYLPILVMPFTVVGWAIVFRQRKWRGVALMLVIWLLVASAAISTLDTSFWHFKRYQIPLMALFIPLAVVALHFLLRHYPQFKRLIYSYAIVVGVLSLLISFVFLHLYRVNTKYVFSQPLRMALWLEENTPEDVVVAVHDVGMIRYMGNRTTIDMVGLTTAGSADSWRNGPGATAEFLETVNPRPDYMAAYTEALGLVYLEDTGLYGELLAEFPILGYEAHNNVALAAPFQGVYRIHWGDSPPTDQVLQPSSLDYLNDFTLIDTLDVADLNSENLHQYQWSNEEQLPGFPTEVYEIDYIDCTLDHCPIRDGGRRINGVESFVMDGLAGDLDAILVTRLHPVNQGTLSVYVNGELIDTRIMPSQPGEWLEVATWIPAEFISESIKIEIIPDTPGGHYMPYFHWLYQGEYMLGGDVNDGIISFQQGSFNLHRYNVKQIEDALHVELEWFSNGGAQGDYRLFVHLYDDITQPPLAQVDIRPMSGTLPPGNWLPGNLSETIVVNLDDIDIGTYQLAIGFYNPRTNERLIPDNEAVEAQSDGRAFLTQVEIE